MSLHKDIYAKYVTFPEVNPLSNIVLFPAQGLPFCLLRTKQEENHEQIYT